MKKKVTAIVSLILLTCLLTACTGNSDNDKNSEKIKIYTTVFPIVDFTKKIGGDYVDVESVYPPGSDAHTFEPTPREMTKIADADIFIYTGVGVEGFVERTIESLKEEDVQFVEAGKGIEYLHSEEEHSHDHDEEGHDHGDIDPHIWLDPIHAITIAENIKNALIEINPDSKTQFEENFQTLKSDLENLDTKFKNVVTSAKTKEILVAHAAYGYWTKRYGIEQISVTGFSPTQEPTQKELMNIIKEAREHDIQYILFEKNVNSKIAETVQNELGIKSLTLYNLEAITEQEIKDNEDYFSLMNKNINTLEQAMK